MQAAATTAVARAVRRRPAAVARLLPLSRAFSANVGDAVPVNIFKAGADPVIKEDSEYPEWVFSMLEPKAKSEDVYAKKETVSWEEGGSVYFRRLGKLKIKEKNAAGDKF